MEINLEAVKEMLNKRFDGNQARMARVLNISRNQLNVVLKSGQSAGKKVIGAIIKYCEVNELDFHKYVIFL